MAKRKYGYITNKERNKRVRQSNQTYGLRKLFITLAVVALVVLVVFAIASLVQVADVIKQHEVSRGSDWDLIEQLCNEIPLSLFHWSDTDAGHYVTLSGFGIFMSVWAVVTVGLSVVALIFVLAMKSPKAAKANLNRLESAALSGKKLEKHANASEVYRERLTNTDKLKKYGKAPK